MRNVGLMALALSPLPAFFGTAEVAGPHIAALVMLALIVGAVVAVAR